MMKRKLLCSKACLVCLQQFSLPARRYDVAKYCSRVCMAIAFKNRVPSETHRKNLSIALMNHIVTDETIEKIKKQLKIKRDSGEWKINSSGLHPHIKGEFHHSEETKHLLSIQRKGIPLSAERRKKISIGQTGKIFTKERCNNISKAKKGKSGRSRKVIVYNLCGCNCGNLCTYKFVRGHNLIGKKQSLETIKKRSLKLKGRKHTLEQNAVTSARLMGHEVTQETRDKIRLKNTGRVLSEKTKLDIGAASKKRWQDPEYVTQVTLNMQGVPKSPETKALMSATWKEILSDPEEVKKRMKNSGVKHLAYQMKNGTTIKMRSGWEIKYAAYLDSLNIIWQYEPKGFILSNGHQYFPDFYLSEINEWREIKGWMSFQSQEKLDLFAKEYPNEKLVVLRDIPKYIINKGTP